MGRLRPPRPGPALYIQVPPFTAKSHPSTARPCPLQPGHAHSSLSCPIPGTENSTTDSVDSSKIKQTKACGPPEKDKGRKTSSCRDLEYQAKQQISSVDPCQKIGEQRPKRDYSMFWVTMVGTHRSPELSDVLR